MYIRVHESALTYAPNRKGIKVLIWVVFRFPFWPKSSFFIPQPVKLIKSRARFNREEQCFERTLAKVTLLCNKKLKRYKPKDPHGFLKVKTEEQLWGVLERFWESSKDEDAEDYLDMVRERNPETKLIALMKAAESSYYI